MFLVRMATNPMTPRFVLWVLSALCLVFGTVTSTLDYLPTPWAFSALFFFAAATGGWAAHDFPNEHALAFAGASMLTALFSRGLALIYGAYFQIGSTAKLSLLEIIGGVSLWWGFAFVLLIMFFRRLEPLASIHRVQG